MTSYHNKLKQYAELLVEWNECTTTATCFIRSSVEALSNSFNRRGSI